MYKVVLAGSLTLFEYKSILYPLTFGLPDSVLGSWLMAHRTPVARYVGLLCYLADFVFVCALCASALFGFSPLCFGFHVAF